MARATVLTILKFAVIGLVLLRLRPTNSQQNQAPGDGEAICTEETIDGTTNPLFDNRPVYSASERPLMDSRDYNRLLQGSGNVYIPWQSVDRDNNNSNEEVTRVSMGIIDLVFSDLLCILVDSNCNSHMCWNSDSVWIQ